MKLGTFECRIDHKNRLFIPAQFRKGLADVVLTIIDKDTVAVYDYENWDVNNFVKDSKLESKKLILMCKYLKSHSYVVHIDAQGRILLPKELISQISFTGNCVAVGNVDAFTLQNKETYLQGLKEEEEAMKEFLSSEEGKLFTRKLKP